MFFVTSSTGALVPFDPSTTQLSRVTPAVPSSEIGVAGALNEPTAAPLASEAAADVTAASASVDDDAAVYEGHAAAGSPAYSDLGNSINVGRAAAIVHYRDLDAAPPQEAEKRDDVAPVDAPEQGAPVDREKRSRKRVDAVGTRGPRYKAPLEERRQAIVAADIMSAPVFTLRDDMAVEAARRVFREHKYRHVPIVSVQGNLVGILSDRDFVSERIVGSDTARSIRDKMVTNILTARPATEIRSIAQVMIGHHIGCLPILDEAGSLVGIITRSDILRAIVNRAPIELWT